MVFDPASRKTVSCIELEAYFAKDSHPDGKVMGALADKLGLNKKQVSNFFERERRKAGVVLPTRRVRTQTPVGASGSAASSASSDPDDYRKSASAKASACQVTSNELSLSGHATISGTGSNAKDSRVYLDSGESEFQQRSVDASVDGSGSLPPNLLLQRTSASHSAAIARPKRAARAPAIVEVDDEHANTGAEGQLQPANIPQRPVLHRARRSAADMDHFDASRGNDNASSSLAALSSPVRIVRSRLGARYAGSHASQPGVDHFAASRSLFAARARAGPAAVPLSSSPSQLSAPLYLPQSSSGGHRADASISSDDALGAPQLYYSPASSSSSVSSPSQDANNEEETLQAYDIGRQSTKYESPTVQFLRNPFPMPEQDCFSYGYSTYPAEPVRKRARTWFTRPPAPPAPASEQASEDGKQSTLSLFGSTRPEDKFEKIKHFAANAASISNIPGSGPMTRLASSAFSGADDDLGGHGSSSEYDVEEIVLMKRRKAQAALKSTIACDELRLAFLANPHPPTSVLDALAVKLGLGKKQVSNYFVRERKKTGYQIKIRHGLNRKPRGGRKKGASGNKLTAAALDANGTPGHASTHASDAGSRAQSELQSVVDEESEVEEEEEEDMEADEEEQEMDLDGAASSADAVYPAIVIDSASDTNEDVQVPELAYDDSYSLHSEGLVFSDSASSLLMLAENSKDGLSSADDELPSPAVLTIQLPALADGGKETHKQAVSSHCSDDIPVVA